MARKRTKALSAAEVRRELEARNFAVISHSEPTETEDGQVLVTPHIEVQVGIDGLCGVVEARDGEYTFRDPTSFIDTLATSLRTALAENNVPKFRAVRWSFDDENVFDGFTDDSRWNGFLNIWVTPEVHEKVLDAYKADLGESGLNEVKPDKNGFYCYGWGFTTHEVDADGASLADRYYAVPPAAPVPPEWHVRTLYRPRGLRQFVIRAEHQPPSESVAVVDNVEDARLIAAAPELLAAVRQLLPLVQEHCSEVASGPINQALHALRRVEGA